MKKPQMRKECRSPVSYDFSLRDFRRRSVDTCVNAKNRPTTDTMKKLNILISLAAATAFAAFPAFAHEGHEEPGGRRSLRPRRSRRYGLLHRP